jgi:hypothetical protein
MEEKRAILIEGINTFEFNLDNHLPNGLYIVTLTMDRKVGQQKILKNSQ